MKIIKNCKSCGKEIQVRPERSTKYCSSECKKKDRPVHERACVNCGKIFTTRFFDSTQKTCSITCRDAIKPKFEKPCAKCGKLFYAPAKNKARYCSKECSPIGKAITKECEQCGTAFDVTKAKYGKQFCSIACRGKADQKRIKKVCEVCSSEFEVKESLSDQRTCSTACGGILRSKEKLQKVCVVCEKTFEVYPSRPDAQTCSHECAISVRAEGTKRRYFITCEHCGNEFEEAHSHSDRRRFCSKACRSNSTVYKQEQSARMDGELNPMWTGGIAYQSQGYIQRNIKGHPFSWSSNYILEHRLVIEEWMREEAPGNKFMIEVEGIEYLSPDIQIHHKDRDRTNNKRNNLVAVTPYAHRLIHAGQVPYKGTYWPETTKVFII